MRLTLLCHAATVATRAAAFPADEPLEPQAIAKIAALTKPLSNYDRVFTSPARRAVQTAAMLGFDAVPEAALRDCDYGSWAGRSMGDVEASDPPGFVAWLENADAAPHGGESIAALTQRVGAWLDANAEGQERMLAVTHAAVIKAIVSRVLDAPPRAFWRIDIAPLSMTRLSWSAGRWTLGNLNTPMVG